METMPVVEVTTFSGSHLLYQKLFVLLENALISRNYSFQWKPLFLVETIGLWQYSFHLVETVPFNGRHFLRCPENCPRVKLPPRLGSGFGLGLALELGLGGNFPRGQFSQNHFPQWKLFLLLEAIHFSENHSIWQKPFPVVEPIPFR